MPMTTNIFDAAGQFTAPLMIGQDRKLQYQIDETEPNFVAKVSIQWIIGDDSPIMPTPNDSRWKTLQDIEVTGSATGYIDGGKAWYRLAITEGNYTSGKATVKLCQG